MIVQRNDMFMVMSEDYTTKLAEFNSRPEAMKFWQEYMAKKKMGLSMTGGGGRSSGPSGGAQAGGAGGGASSD